MVNLNEIYEGIIVKKLNQKAQELGIEFKVKYSEDDGMVDYLLRIKTEHPKISEDSSEEEVKLYKEEVERHKEFTSFASDIIVDDYANQIRFSYPAKL